MFKNGSRKAPKAKNSMMLPKISTTGIDVTKTKLFCKILFRHKIINSNYCGIIP